MATAKFQIPGFVWVAVLALIPLLVQWLQGEYFAGQTWVSIAVIALGALAKLIEVLAAQEQTRIRADAYGAPPTGFPWRRFMLG